MRASQRQQGKSTRDPARANSSGAASPTAARWPGDALAKMAAAMATKIPAKTASKIVSSISAAARRPNSSTLNPGRAQPGGAKSGGEKPGGAKPGPGEPLAWKPRDWKPGDWNPGDWKPGDWKPGDRIALAIALLRRRALAVVRGGVVILGACLAWVVGLPLIAAVDLEGRLPPLQTLLDGRERHLVTVLDRDGVVLGSRGQRYSPITVDEAAPVLVDAVLAIEDRRYYWHPGFDPIGLARALAANYAAGRTVQGGSSISQQVAKLAFLSRERTVERKLREAPLALAMEWAFTKDELLSIYLNRVYLGAGAYGFEAASQRYFGKTARHVSVAEAALLAGLLRAPSRWSPESNFTGARARAEVVLDAMGRSGRINVAQAYHAREMLATMAEPSSGELAPHFVDWIVEQVEAALIAQARAAARAEGRRFSAARDAVDARKDLVVQTTLDAEAQTAALSAVERMIDGAPEDLTGVEAAVALLSLDGKVRAMVGGRDYGRSQFNRAAVARRQMGSSFKPFVFAAALEAGLRPNAYVEDAPIQVGTWRPQNYDGQYRGWVTLEEALAASSNAATVRVFQQAGVDQVIAMARRFGFEHEIAPYPSLALGALEATPLEVSAAYATFARGGAAPAVHAIDAVRLMDGEVVWTPPPAPARRALDERRTGWMTTMMREVVWSGTGRRAALGELPVAGKTGTTQGYRDAWFAGFTGHYVAAVWLGFDDNTPLPEIVGGQTPAEIWRETMAPLHEGRDYLAVPERPIPPPSDRPGAAAVVHAAPTPRAATPASTRLQQRRDDEPVGFRRQYER